MNEFPFSPTEWEACLKVLKALQADPFHNPDNQTFKTLFSSIHKKVRKNARNQSIRDQLEYQDAELIKSTSIVKNALNNTTHYRHESQENAAYRDLNSAEYCYVCNNPYQQLHFFYHRLCPGCAEENYAYRLKPIDLSGWQIIITGGRVKIGYATALKCLQSGANVLLTTRFPALAWQQFSLEPDYQEWRDRLTIYGLDLRNLKAVDSFCQYCFENLEYLDILINNAAQTIKYPETYYQPLMQREGHLMKEHANSRLLSNLTPVATPQAQLMSPQNWQELPLNRFGQPVDFREKNSWNAKLTEIGLEELLEVNLINHISPYALISALTPLLEKSQKTERFIINVTSSEGQFSYANKTIHHPHTNMTKAALNMLTRTSAAEYHERNIFMNAVDVGWVSTGANEEKRSRLFDQLRIPPLDSVDGAMRILHPIVAVTFEGQKGLFGKLLKNYREVEW
jgi:NAD(P)-dependent dehydrogenase (short-subunit alcohol dehydrogenase family)